MGETDVVCIKVNMTFLNARTCASPRPQSELLSELAALLARHTHLFSVHLRGTMWHARPPQS